MKRNERLSAISIPPHTSRPKGSDAGCVTGVVTRPATDRTSVAISVICIPNDVALSEATDGPFASILAIKSLRMFLALLQLRQFHVEKKSALRMNYVSPSVADR